MQTAQYMLRTGRRGSMHEFAMAVADLRNSTQRIGLAWSLAWHDIVSRYRGSILGPLWITLSMGLMVLGISFVYSHLFEIPLNDFVPFVACGIVFWGVISGTIVEGCDTFVQASGMLSQTSLPMLTFVWRTVLRSLINLCHHVVIIVAVLAWYGTWHRANVPLALGGLLLVLLNISWITLAVAIACARFRDIPQIVTSVITFAIFLTPVFWKARGALLDHALLNLNPFFHMLDVVRAPLLGFWPSSLSYLTLVVMAIAGWTITFTVFAFTRRRIVHYL